MTDEFLAHRRMLLGLAYRLLGTLYDAEDVLQEAYLRWSRADRSEVLEPRRYLTRVVARLAVDTLRARRARREEYVGTWLPEPVRTGAPGPGSSGSEAYGGAGQGGAGQGGAGVAAAGIAGVGASGYATAGLSGGGLGEADGLGEAGGVGGRACGGGRLGGGGGGGGGVAHGLDDVVDTSDLSIAVLHLMERLTPPQRAVYVLRTAFELPYAEIAGILKRSEQDCRQLQRRAGVALAGRARFSSDPAEHMRLLEAFVAAARNGDVERLEQLLHEDVIAWSDGGGRVRTALNPIRGRAKVVRFFVGIMRRRSRSSSSQATSSRSTSSRSTSSAVTASDATGGQAAGSHAIGGVPFTAVPTGVNGQYALLVEASYRYTMCVSVVDGRIQDLFRIANPAKLSTFGGEDS